MALHTHMSICAGIGGLDLGLRLALPGLRTVCYIEREAYAASVLVARMEDKALDRAPVWDDVATVDSGRWRGCVDIISAGYPCQPFSCAGRRKGSDDPRHLWPHIARIVTEVEPEWIFLENVAGHLRLGFGEVWGELRGMGYLVEAGLFTAAEVGAPHIRKRLFVLAHTQGGGFDCPPQQEMDEQEVGGEAGRGSDDGGEDLADRPRDRLLLSRYTRSRRCGSENGGGDLGDPNLAGLAGPRVGGCQCTDELSPWPPSPQDTDVWRRVLEVEPGLEPAFCRVVDGVPADVGESRLRYRPDQLRCLGNAVVPVVAAYAFRVLYRRLSGGDVT